MEPKKPMLACDAPEDLIFPVYASPKLDGVRCTVWGDKPRTRALKEVPNVYTHSTLANARLPAVFDGELVVGEANHPDVYRRTISGVMSHAGAPDFTFWVFDYVPQLAGLESYEHRLRRMQARTSAIQAFYPWFKLLPQVLVQNNEELLAYEAEQLALGFEGVILRKPSAPYKHGRSTAKEGYLLKVKRFHDAEAVVIGVEEQMHNSNPATINALGHTERSTHQAGMIPKGVLGALVCRTPEGVEFRVGTGFTDAERAALWAVRETLIGKLAKYKSFAVGVKDAPRFPVWLGFRDPSDI